MPDPDPARTLPAAAAARSAEAAAPHGADVPAARGADAPAPRGADTPAGFADPALIPIGELAERCGIAITDCTPQRIAATMPVAGNRQPFNLLHGGASAVLAETIGSVHATMLAGPGRVAVGIELNCTHHRSATAGLVTAVSTPLHVGRSISTFHIAIRDDAGRPTCTARLTCMTRSAGHSPDTVTGRPDDTLR